MRTIDKYLVLISFIILITVILGLITVLPKIEAYNQTLEEIK